MYLKEIGVSNFKVVSTLEPFSASWAQEVGTNNGCNNVITQRERALLVYADLRY
jgi:hypothetical protein